MSTGAAVPRLNIPTPGNTDGLSTHFTLEIQAQTKHARLLHLSAPISISTCKEFVFLRTHITLRSPRTLCSCQHCLHLVILVSLSTWCQYIYRGDMCQGASQYRRPGQRREWCFAPQVAKSHNVWGPTSKLSFYGWIRSVADKQVANSPRSKDVSTCWVVRLSSLL